eukprot:XP_011662124.1 PREDICTED: uncharacterized protein LOC105437336 [Strongylocentrotus purpuratus]
MSRPNSTTPSVEGAESFEEITKEDIYLESNEYESVSPENPAGSYQHSRDRMHNDNDFGTSTTEESSMPSTQDMMDELLGDINAMIESASSIVEAARQIRYIVQHSVECVDLERPGISQLGLIGTIKDLRRETVRAVVDADRAHLRFTKVLTEFCQLRRCLKRLGVLSSTES